MIDARANFIKSTFQGDAGIDTDDTSLTVADASSFPDPATKAYNVVIWNITDYANPTDAYANSQAEIVRVTGKSSNTLTITRAQESTTGRNFNTAGKTYAVALTLTAKTITDIETDIANARLFTILPSADHSAVGPATTVFNLGATITAMQLVYLGSSGKWLLTDADAAATTQGMLGIALIGGDDTDPTTAALKGSFVRDDSWSWTPGAILYASTTPGAITATAPTGEDDAVRVVGFALTADVIYFDPSPDFITYAA